MPKGSTANKAADRPNEVWWVAEGAYGLPPSRGRLFIRKISAFGHRTLIRNKGRSVSLSHGVIIWDDPE